MFIINKLKYIIEILIMKGKMFMSELADKLQVSNSAIFYANCIVSGMSTFKRCPIKLKEDVAFVLVALGNEDLVTDHVYLEEAKKRIAEHEAENNQ